MAPPPNPKTGKMNAHGCPGLKNFYTCSAGDLNGCCSINPCDTGVCPDEKASNQGESSSSSPSESSSTSEAETGNINGPLMGTKMTTIKTAMTMDTDAGMGRSGATTTNAGPATTAGTGSGMTTQPQAGTVWSIPGGISAPSPRPAFLGTPSRPDTITTTENTSTSPSTSTSTNLSTSTISPSNTTTSTASLYPTEQTEFATSSPDTNPNTSSSGGNNKALIGGVVGGILALGIILAVIFVLFCRHKKKRRRRFTLLAWHGPQHNGGREKGVVVAAAGVGSGESLQAGPTNCNQIQPTPISTTLPATSPNFNTHTPTSTTRLLQTQTPTLPSPASSFTSPSPERRYRHALSPIPSIPSNPSLHSTISSKHDMALGIEQDLGVHPALRGTNTETQAERAIGTGIGTRTEPETTPELGDTGFYRQRAELATYSQSELINIPHERRHPVPTPTPIPNPTSSSNDNPHRPRGTKIITPDGVLLFANFERFPGCEDYATSFAQCFDGWGIQLVEEEVLPAYGGSEEEVRVDGGGDEKRRESGDGEDLRS